MAGCRQEVSSEGLTSDDRAGLIGQPVLYSEGSVTPRVGLSPFEWNRVTVKSGSDLITLTVGGNCWLCVA